MILSKSSMTTFHSRCILSSVDSLTSRMARVTCDMYASCTPSCSASSLFVNLRSAFNRSRPIASLSWNDNVSIVEMSTASTGGWRFRRGIGRHPQPRSDLRGDRQTCRQGNGRAHSDGALELSLKLLCSSVTRYRPKTTPSKRKPIVVHSSNWAFHNPVTLRTPARSAHASGAARTAGPEEGLHPPGSQNSCA